MEKQVITVNDKEYDVSALDNNEIALLNHVNSLRNQIAEATFKLDQLRVAESAFATSLVNSLEKETVDESSE